MFSFFKKYKIAFKILAVIVFALGAYMRLQEYFGGVFETPKDKKLKLIFGIVFGLMALFQLVDLFEALKEKSKKIAEKKL